MQRSPCLPPREKLSLTLYAADNSLATIRFLFILLVGSFGFFRIVKINNFCIKGITFKSDHATVYFAKRKNDQHRDSHISYLARSGRSKCPVAITEKVLKVLPQSNSSYPLIHHIVKSRSGEHFHLSRGVSDSTLRGEFKKHVKPFVDDVSKLVHVCKA